MTRTKSPIVVKPNIVSLSMLDAIWTMLVIVMILILACVAMILAKVVLA